VFGEMASRLASLGYAVLVPDVYYRSGDWAPFDMAGVFGDAAGAAIHADWVARCNPMLFREVNLPVPEGAY
jgi:dienelactone hydrolase